MYPNSRIRTTWLALAGLLICLSVRTGWAASADDQFALAAAHYSAARWALAIDEFETFLTAHASDPRCEPVRFYLAECHVQKGTLPEARRWFDEYLRQTPQGKYAQRAEFRMGETEYLAGDHESAKVDLRRFWQAHPDDELCAYALVYLGEMELEAQSAQSAQEVFAECLKRYPEGPLASECRYGLARALESLGDTEGSMRFYRYLSEQAKETSLRDDALLRLAILQYHAADYVGARQSLEQHVDRFPGSELAAHARYWLGMTQLAQGDHPAAADTLEAAVQRYPQHELAAAMTYAAADALRRAQQPERAGKLCRRVLQDWPKSEWADDSLNTLIQLSWEGRRLDETRQLATQFQEQYSDSELLPVVQQTLARAAIKDGDYADAVKALEPSADSPSADSVTADSATAVERKTEITPARESASEPSAVGQIAPTTRDTNQYYLALALLGESRYQDALRTLEPLAAIQSPAELVDGVRVARAAALLGLERYAEAVEPLQTYLQAPTSRADVERCRAQLVVVFARLERWNDIDPVLDAFRGEHQDNDLYESTLEYLAESAGGKGQRERGRTWFAELGATAYQAARAAHGLAGEAWLESQRPEQLNAAVTTLDRLKQRFPTAPAVPETALLVGQALERAGRSQEALGLYRLVVQTHCESTHYSAALLAAARVCDAQQLDGEAESHLRKWLDAHPAAPEREAALYQLAWVLVDQGHDDDADQVFEQIRSLGPAGTYWADATYRLAERAVRVKDMQRAAALATEIAASRSAGRMVSYAIFLQGQLAATNQRWDDVLRSMERLQREYPDSELKLSAEYWLAEAHYRLHQLAPARERFDRLQQAAAGRQEPWLAMVPLRRAQVRAQEGQWDEAFAIAQTIAADYPEFNQQHEVDYLLGRYYMNRAEFDNARGAYQRVLDSPTGAQTETSAMAQWMIGETHFMQRDYHQAIKAYHRVEVLHGFPQWQAAALLQAGKCHEMLGQWDEASKLYTQILRDYRDTRVAEKANLRLRMAQQRTPAVQTR